MNNYTLYWMDLGLTKGLRDGKIINETVIGLAFCTKPRKTWTWRVQKDKSQKITVSLITVKLLKQSAVRFILAALCTFWHTRMPRSSIFAAQYSLIKCP